MECISKGSISRNSYVIITFKQIIAHIYTYWHRLNFPNNSQLSYANHHTLKYVARTLYISKVLSSGKLHEINHACFKNAFIIYVNKLLRREILFNFIFGINCLAFVKEGLNKYCPCVIESEYILTAQSVISLNFKRVLIFK